MNDRIYEKWIEKVTLTIKRIRPPYPPPTYLYPEGTYRSPKPHYTGGIGPPNTPYPPRHTGRVGAPSIHVSSPSHTSGTISPLHPTVTGIPLRVPPFSLHVNRAVHIGDLFREASHHPSLSLNRKYDHRLVILHCASCYCPYVYWEAGVIGLDGDDVAYGEVVF